MNILHIFILLVSPMTLLMGQEQYFKQYEIRNICFRKTQTAISIQNITASNAMGFIALRLRYTGVCEIRLQGPAGYFIFLNIFDLFITHRPAIPCQDYVKIGDERYKGEYCERINSQTAHASHSTEKNVAIIIFSISDMTALPVLNISFTFFKQEINGYCEDPILKNKCDNGHCIWPGLFCNSINNCGDNSDELCEENTSYQYALMMSIAFIIFIIVAFCLYDYVSSDKTPPVVRDFSLENALSVPEDPQPSKRFDSDFVDNTPYMNSDPLKYPNSDYEYDQIILGKMQKTISELKLLNKLERETNKVNKLKNSQRMLDEYMKSMNMSSKVLKEEKKLGKTNITNMDRILEKDNSLRIGASSDEEESDGNDQSSFYKMYENDLKRKYLSLKTESILRASQMKQNSQTPAKAVIKEEGSSEEESVYEKELKVNVPGPSSNTATSSKQFYRKSRSAIDPKSQSSKQKEMISVSKFPNSFTPYPESKTLTDNSISGRQELKVLKNVDSNNKTPISTEAMIDNYYREKIKKDLKTPPSSPGATENLPSSYRSSLSRQPDLESILITRKESSRRHTNEDKDSSKPESFRRIESTSNKTPKKKYRHFKRDTGSKERIFVPSNDSSDEEPKVSSKSSSRDSQTPSKRRSRKSKDQSKEYLINITERKTDSKS